MRFFGLVHRFGSLLHDFLGKTKLTHIIYSIDEFVHSIVDK